MSSEGHRRRQASHPRRATVLITLATTLLAEKKRIDEAERVLDAAAAELGISNDVSIQDDLDAEGAGGSVGRAMNVTGDDDEQRRAERALAFVSYYDARASLSSLRRKGQQKRQREKARSAAELLLVDKDGEEEMKREPQLSLTEACKESSGASLAQLRQAANGRARSLLLREYTQRALDKLSEASGNDALSLEAVEWLEKSYDCREFLYSRGHPELALLMEKIGNTLMECSQNITQKLLIACRVP